MKKIKMVHVIMYTLFDKLTPLHDFYLYISFANAKGLEIENDIIKDTSFLVLSILNACRRELVMR